ncbi:MAG: hypothetical protein HY392_04830 [Candidatus Diapherotrites archaeon]|nr:hypothetical protein [Candidatus Diapherotrites archaeon]
MAQKPEDENPEFIVSGKTPPAFAGVLIDWKIGPKEITATLIDLIARDFLHVHNTQVFRMSRKLGLREFEQKFISELFGQKNSLNFQEIEKIAYKNKYGVLLKIICRGMIEEGFVDKDFQKKTCPSR